MAGERLHGWFALQTRLGRERAVTSILQGKAYDVFLPLFESRRQWTDRVKTRMLPLFPGYVFCRSTATAIGRIVTTPGVLRIVGFGGTPALVDDDEIEAIRRITASGVPVSPCECLRAGQAVTIAKGPLAGLRGVFVRAGGHHQLVVSVRLLRRAVAVRMDADSIRPDDVTVSGRGVGGRSASQ